MRSAEARRSASTMISSSMRLSLTGGHVDWMTKTSRPRVFSRMRIMISPSENRPTSAAPSSTPR